jgi:hypothetical protein
LKAVIPLFRLLRIMSLILWPESDEGGLSIDMDGWAKIRMEIWREGSSKREVLGREGIGW